MIMYYQKYWNLQLHYIACLLLVALKTTFCINNYPELYIDNLCNKLHLLKESESYGVIRMTNKDVIHTPMDCVVQIYPHNSTYTMSLNVTHINISQCAINRLEISDVKFRGSRIASLCDWKSNQTGNYIVPSGRLYLRFLSYLSEDTWDGLKFQVTIYFTLYKVNITKHLDTWSNTCTAGEFECEHTKRCVSSKLECDSDSELNCEDMRDKIYCQKKVLSGGVLALIVFASYVLIFLPLGCYMYRIRVRASGLIRRRQEAQQAELDAGHTPTSVYNSSTTVLPSDHADYQRARDSGVTFHSSPANATIHWFEPDGGPLSTVSYQNQHNPPPYQPDASPEPPSAPHADNHDFEEPPPAPHADNQDFEEPPPSYDEYIRGNKL